MAAAHALDVERAFAIGVPKGDVRDFAGLLTKLFVQYPERKVAKVCEVGGVIIGKFHHHPSIADFKRELDELVQQGLKIQTAAVNNIQEHERRKREREEDEANNPTPEQRAASIARWEERKREMEALSATQELEETRLTGELLASLQRRKAMLERDPRTVLSSDDLVTPARPPSEELKAKARAPLNNPGERWQ